MTATATRAERSAVERLQRLRDSLWVAHERAYIREVRNICFDWAGGDRLTTDALTARALTGESLALPLTMALAPLLETLAAIHEWRRRVDDILRKAARREEVDSPPAGYISAAEASRRFGVNPLTMGEVYKPILQRRMAKVREGVGDFVSWYFHPDDVADACRARDETLRRHRRPDSSVEEVSAREAAEILGIGKWKLWQRPFHEAFSQLPVIRVDTDGSGRRYYRRADIERLKGEFENRRKELLRLAQEEALRLDAVRTERTATRAARAANAARRKAAVLAKRETAPRLPAGAVLLADALAMIGMTRGRFERIKAGRSQAPIPRWHRLDRGVRRETGRGGRPRLYCWSEDITAFLADPQTNRAEPTPMPTAYRERKREQKRRKRAHRAKEKREQC